jgi:streptogramin lyase
MTVQRLRTGAAVAVLLLAGCGGGGGGSVPAASLGAVTAPQPPASSGSSKLGIAISVPGGSSASSARVPRFISPSTASLTVALQGAQTPLATINVTPSSPGCSPAPLGIVCTATVSAPVGSNTYVVTTYDAVNATGHQLATATLVATVTINATNTLALVLNGTVANATVILGTTSVTAGVPNTVAVTVVALDAAGNVIVGPGNYSTPVTLTNSDTSGATTLSRTSITAPGQTVSLSYSGNSLLGATITPMVGSTAGTGATFTPTGYTVANFNVPAGDTGYDDWGMGALTTGPDGNLWYGTYGIIGKVTPNGQFTEYTNGVPVDHISALAAGADGNMWFGTYSDNLGQITPTGTVTMLGTSCGEVYNMVAGPDGNLWFSDYNCGYVGVINPTTMAVQEYDITQLSGWPGGTAYPEQIAFGPDGKLYIADYVGGSIDQITIAGGVPTAVNRAVLPSGCYAITVARGPDGNMWFSDDCYNIGQVSPSNFSAAGMAEWSMTGVTDASGIWNVVATPDGLWATDWYTGTIYRFSALGAVVPPGPVAASSPAPTGPVTGTPPVVIPVKAFAYPYASAYAIAVGPDHNIWVAEDDYSPFAFAKVAYGSVATGAQSAGRSLGPMSRTHRAPLGKRQIQQLQLRNATSTKRRGG